MEVHAPGNPQTVMNSYTPDGSITIDNIEGRVRQLALEESRKGIPGEVDYRRVLEIVRGEGVQGKAAVAIADRTITWLLKSMKIKVWK